MSSLSSSKSSYTKGRLGDADSTCFSDFNAFVDDDPFEEDGNFVGDGVLTDLYGGGAEVGGGTCLFVGDTDRVDAND